MWILCALIGLFQLIILLMLSGILFSVAAVSRLMEITIILIHPTAVFLLRQSANLIILLTILMAKMTSSAFRKLCTLVKCNQHPIDQHIVNQHPVDQYPVDQQEAIPQQEPSLGITGQLQLDAQTPFVTYKRNILEEIPKDILPLKELSTASLANESIIELPQNQSQDNSSVEESTA